MRCRKCHYRLNDLTEPRCPECGTEFDPEDPATYDVYTQARQIPVAARLVFIAVCCLTCGPLAIYSIFDATPYSPHIVIIIAGLCLIPFAYDVFRNIVENDRRKD